MFKYVRYTEAQNQYTKLGFEQQNEDVKVNRFDKPIVSLEAEDESLIDALIASQDEAINCEEITQEEFTEIYKLTAQYQRVLDVSEEALDKASEVIIKEYPLGERESFFIQIEEAKAYKISGDEADAIYLKGLAEAEGDTLESFVDAVIRNNTIFKSLHQKALSEKRRVKRELMMEIGA